MIRRAVVWTFAGQGASFVFSYFGSIAVARLLSPYELGVFAVAMAVVGVLQIVQAFGVGLYVVREADLTLEKLDAAYTVNAILSLALAAFTAAAAWPAAWFLKEPAVTRVLLLLALSPLIGIPAFRPSTMLQREIRFGPLSVMGVLSTASTTVTTVTAAALGASYMSPAYGALVSALLVTIVTVAIAPRHVSFRMSLAGWRPIMLFGTQVMSVSGLAMLANKITAVLLGRLLGLTALGLLSRASNLSDMINQYGYGTAMRVVFAQLSKDYRERGVVRDSFIPGLRMMAGAVGPLVIGIAVLSNPLVLTLYGDKWTAVGPILSLYMVAQFLILSFAMNWEVYLIRDQITLQVKFEAARSIFGLVSSVIASVGGVVWVAFSSVLDQVFSMFLYLPRMAKLTDSTNRELGGIYGETILLTFATCAPSLALMWWHHWSPRTPLEQIAVAVLIGGGLWLALLARMAHPLWKEMRHFAAAATTRLRAQA